MRIQYAILLFAVYVRFIFAFHFTVNKQRAVTCITRRKLPPSGRGGCSPNKGRIVRLMDSDNAGPRDFVRAAVCFDDG